jgi:hypothetical protein
MRLHQEPGGGERQAGRRSRGSPASSVPEGMLEWRPRRSAQGEWVALARGDSPATARVVSVMSVPTDDPSGHADHGEPGGGVAVKQLGAELHDPAVVAVRLRAGIGRLQGRVGGSGGGGGQSGLRGRQVAVDTRQGASHESGKGLAALERLPQSGEAVRLGGRRRQGEGGEGGVQKEDVALQLGRRFVSGGRCLGGWTRRPQM